MNEKILVIDDEADILQFMDNLLTREGYCVKSALRGREALNLFQSEPFDLVITDVRMPEMDGMEVLKQVKRLDENAEVIVLTGHATIENAVNALKGEGAYDYLTKPLEDINGLLHIIEQALEKRRLKIENKTLLMKLRQEVEAHKFSAEQVEKNRKLLQLIIDGISEPLIMFGRNLSVIKLNRAAAVYAHKDFKDTIGKSCPEIFGTDCRPCEECDLYLSVSKGSRISFERPRPQDTSRTEQIDIFPLEELSGDSSVVRITDITDKKRIQEQVNLTERLSSLSDFSGGIAHEIRNPLAGMNLFLDILSDKEKFAPTDRELEILKDMKEGIERISAIVKRVLDFSRAGYQSAGVMGINTLVKESMHQWQGQIDKKNIALDLSLAKELPLFAGDRTAIKQVISNILQNSLEAMNNGGGLKVVTAGGMSIFKKNTAMIVMIIEDTGPGIRPEHLKSVFNPFFTTHPANTGLGLTIAHQVVKNHGGFIRMQSDFGRGTTVTIELPPAVPEDKGGTQDS